MAFVLVALFFTAIPLEVTLEAKMTIFDYPNVLQCKGNVKRNSREKFQAGRSKTY